jgi:protein-arginine kinase activator protein McsA
MPEINSPAFDFEKVRSVNYLRSALEQVEEAPEDPVHQLQEELEEAVETEDYERAARLRDHIRELS